jgi:hypothetical protein
MDGDRWARECRDWFLNIQYRMGAFGDSYPFMLSPRTDSILLRDNLDIKQKLYIFFLLAANLPYASNSQRFKLASNFECLCYRALQMLMPTHAEVHQFGKSSTNTGRYTGTLWSKVNTLASDLNVSLSSGVNIEHFSPHDTGDNGLDLVAWIPMSSRSSITGRYHDGADGLIVIFAQCACSADQWASKQHSSSAQHWRSLLQLKADYVNMAFIPFCFRDASGGWHKPHEISATVLVDRLRLMYMLRDYTTENGALEWISFADDALAHEEPVN